jgi:beta-apo-4'-carotenal oxygenase
MSEKKPGFDREGRDRGGMIWWVLGLGSKGKTGAGARWAVVVAIAAVVMRMLRM